MQKCGRMAIFFLPPPPAITVDKQLDGLKGNCPESWHRLCIICWQNCQWVNDHGQLAQRRRAFIPLCLCCYWRERLPPLFAPLDENINCKRQQRSQWWSERAQRWRGGNFIWCRASTSADISGVWRVNQLFSQQCDATFCNGQITE